jgi:RNase P/RNase MRP subunit p30
MRKFVDLHLRAPIKDLNQVERMVRKSSELGYRLAGITLPPHITRDQINQLQHICNDAKIDFVTRVNFYPKTPRELLHDLRRFRRKFEIISVTCTSKSVARQAAKDRRVDLLHFPATDLRKRFFDHAEAELASKALSSLEIEMAPLLLLTGFKRIRLLSRLRREVAIAERFKVPVTVSSGATNEYFIRGPHDYASLTTLFDMSMSSALCALSESPLAIVERNREKLSPNYVAPGIRVVGRKNCV